MQPVNLLSNQILSPPWCMKSSRGNKSNLWKWFLISTFLLSFLLPFSTIQAQGEGGGGGGMVPVSEVKTHVIDNKRPTKKVLLTESEIAKADAKAKVKADVHVKIATSHLQDKEEETGIKIQQEKTEAGNKIVRKDKSPELQNPQKHASEDWLLHFLLEQYLVSDNNVEEQVDILQNLENFSHKFENGRDLFQSTNALKSILLPALNSTHADIRKAACGVFAIAAQNNAIVQNSALENGVVRRLVHLLTFDQPVRSRALFALSSLLRNFPVAQKKFIQDGGVSALVKVAFYSETRKRSLNFIADMLTERKYCRLEEAAEEKERKRLGSKATLLSDLKSSIGDLFDDPCDSQELLEKSLRANGWCEVLQDSIKNLPGFDAEDQILTIEAVNASLTFCSDSVTPYARVFHRLLVKFEEDEDFSNVGDLLEQILAKIDPLALSARYEL